MSKLEAALVLAQDVVPTRPLIEFCAPIACLVARKSHSQQQPNSTAPDAEDLVLEKNKFDPIIEISTQAESNIGRLLKMESPTNCASAGGRDLIPAQRKSQCEGEMIHFRLLYWTKGRIQH